jgi:hypothetical protein
MSSGCEPFNQKARMPAVAVLEVFPEFHAAVPQCRHLRLPDHPAPGKPG